ncbi:MAG: TauD/TfdA family dioxygenase [Alphaproteobacteria bacterium]
MKLKRLSGALGAEIEGVDLGRDIDQGVAADVRAALGEHGFLVFRDQAIDVEAHKRIARHFGDIFIHPNFNTGDHDPEVVSIVRAPGDTRIVGEDWHTDTTMMPEPPMGALLYALETPPYGGDTLFAAQWLAYDALSDGLKATLEGLKCIHSDIKVAGPHNKLNARRATVIREDADWRPTESAHPVVRTHPDTGRKCLFVNHSYSIRFEGWTEAESKPLLDFLMNWGHKPEFTCRVAWRDRSLTFWDNRSTKHLAVNDVHDHRRVMRRIQIAGGPVR